MQRRAARRPSQRRPHASIRRVALASFVSTLGVLGALVALSAAETTVAAGSVANPSGTSRPAHEPLESPLEVSPAPASAAAGAVAILPPPTPSPPQLTVVEGVIEPGTTLSSALRGQGVSPAMVHAITTAMRPHFDFRKARPGHAYRLARDQTGELVGFDYRTSTTTGYRMWRVGDRLEVDRQEAQLVPRTATLAGLVVTTLYAAVVDLGEQGQLARDFADVFAWDIDFQRSVQPGDAFQVVYERLNRVAFDGSETYVRPGRILAARYDGTAGRHTAIYFEAEEGRGGYYRPDGSSVEGEFLMAPIRSARITSSFSKARRHPILKITRPHPGIDYAGPHGAPVWSVAEGEVIHRARAGGFGNLVKVRHENGYVSYYAHLSRFAKDLRVGQRVEQKQVIGYVGQTGLATGPHVCFRIRKDGEYVNPARLRTGSRGSVPRALLPVFEARRSRLLAELDGGRVVTGSL